MKYVILLTSFMLVNAYGNECGNKQSVFQCPVKHNRTLTVCGEGDELFYRFGKTGKPPEKTIKRNINDVDYKLWNGYGSTAKQSITFKEKTHSFRVYSRYQRLHNGKPTKRLDIDFDMVASGGVQVIKGKRVIGTVRCYSKKMVDNIENYKLGEPLTKVKSNAKPKLKTNGDDNCKKTVFSCTTKNKKFIKVCKTPTSYIYHFGKLGKKSELTLKRRHADVIKTPWNGMGVSMTQSIGFVSKGATTYSVFSSVRRGKNGVKNGGVLVELGTKDISIDCESDSIEDHIIDEVR